MRTVVLLATVVALAAALSVGATLAVIDSSPGLLPQGAQGPRGPQGKSGPRGPAGEAGAPGADATSVQPATADGDSAATMEALCRTVQNEYLNRDDDSPDLAAFVESLWHACNQ